MYMLPVVDRAMPRIAANDEQDARVPMTGSGTCSLSLRRGSRTRELMDWMMVIMVVTLVNIDSSHSNIFLVNR